ncbi:MAG: ribonuclease G [Dehalococcoidia bacterium]|nr:ribonuclease G [Dehalococcoidia bacterium]
MTGWNWGAFSLTWIWGIGNRVWLSFLALIPIPLIVLVMMVILGIKGNEWAWQCKKWDSIEQFRHRQRIWMYWGIAGLLAPFVFIIGLTLIIVGLLGYYGYIG